MGYGKAMSKGDSETTYVDTVTEGCSLKAGSVRGNPIAKANIHSTHRVGKCSQRGQDDGSMKFLISIFYSLWCTRYTIGYEE